MILIDPATIRRVLAAELAQLDRDQLAALSQNPDALADAILSRLGTMGTPGTSPALPSS